MSSTVPLQRTVRTNEPLGRLGGMSITTEGLPDEKRPTVTLMKFIPDEELAEFPAEPDSYLASNWPVCPGGDTASVLLWPRYL